jgi:hypothetical protein
MIWTTYYIHPHHPPQTIPRNCSSSYHISYMCDYHTPDPDLTAQYILDHLNESAEKLGRPCNLPNSVAVSSDIATDFDGEDYDIVNPFIPGGRYGNETLWSGPRPWNPGYSEIVVIDLIRFYFTIHTARTIRQLPLKLIGERHVTMADFQYIGCPIPSSIPIEMP